MFKITVEAERRFVLVETSGLGTVGEVAAFAREEEAILRTRGWNSGDFTMLMHTLDTIPQPQDVIQALQDHLHRNPRKPHRLAVVKGGAIAGMQTRRVLTSDHAAHFATIEEATEWLAKCPPFRTFPRSKSG